MHSFRRARSSTHGLSWAGFVLLFCMSLSVDARGSHEDDGPTQDSELSPGIHLRIESCGFVEPPTGVVGDDDDSAGDDDDSAGDDDDSAGDDDDSAAGP